MTAAKAKRAVDELKALVECWNWCHEWDPAVIAALVPATFVQACWTWRPMVSITGPSDSGKSTFLSEVLVPLFGDWAISADRCTEAGLRQAIGRDASPVVIDEFDKYKGRQAILELFRTSSRGGKILRGTQDQSGQEYGMKHLGWFAAIESGDLWGQDRNRFIRLELLPPAARGTLQLPTPAALKRIGEQLAAVGLWAAPAAIPLADAIKSTSIEDVHGRLVESFSVPAALWAVAQYGRQATPEQATEVLHCLIEDRDSLQSQGEPDEIQLLRDIVATNLRVTFEEQGTRGSDDRTVGQLLNCYRTYAKILEAKGIKVVQLRSGAWVLFLATAAIRRELLRGTRWSESRIDQILQRLPGAKRGQQRCGGQKPWGIELPWPDGLACLGGLGDEQDTPSDDE